MSELNELHPNPFINTLLTTIGSFFAIFGFSHEQLEYIDLGAAIILKVVSILAFAALVIINWNKVLQLIKWVDKNNKDEKK